jgi:SAM-dependent methyltransferase
MPRPPQGDLIAPGTTPTDRPDSSISLGVAGQPMSDDLQREYAMRFERNADYRRAVWQILTSEFFSRWTPPEATVLDLGCGWGEFINQVKAAKRYGMDLNPDARVKLVPEVTLLEQDCSARWQLPDASLDVIFTSNFFEHLPTKEGLRRTLDEAFRCLKPNGRMICLGPNVKYLSGGYWDFWDHYLPLTELSVKEGMELAGFAVESAIAKFLPYSMSQGFTPPLFLLRLYLKLPFLWRVFGAQFLVIARKLPRR